VRPSLVYLFLICGLTVLAGCGAAITESHRGKSAMVVGHAFLVANQAEGAGYGLYSYLLFGSPPSDADRNLYLQAISACLRELRDIQSLEDAGFDRRELNITYLPIREPLPRVFSSASGLSPHATTVLDEWILDHYNYDRARSLLRFLRGAHRTGPYIISTLHPLGGYEPFPARYLLQDLSLVPYDQPDLIYAWVREFLQRASQPQRWEEVGAKQFAERLRQGIAMVATDVPEIRNTLDSRITWVDMASVR
jgi:hypothetical protein